MNNARKPLVAVIGDATVEPGGRRDQLAERTGELLVSAGYRVLTGGLGGVMEAACRGAHRSGTYQPGDTVGILPGYDPTEANPFVDVAMPTGLDHLRNALVASADAVVVVGGGAGTLAEIAFAWIYKRLIVAYRDEGWGGRLADSRIDDRVRYPDMAEDRIFGANTPDEAIGIIARWMVPLRRATSPDCEAMKRYPHPCSPDSVIR